MTNTTAPAAFAAAYVAGALYEAIDAWPARNGGVVIRIAERDDGEQRDTLVILSQPDSVRLMAWLNDWFSRLPLAERAELADGLDPRHVPGGDFLTIARASEHNVRDFPSIGRPAAEDVDLAELLVAAE